MTQSKQNVSCSSCKCVHALTDLTDGKFCPNCSEQLLYSAAPSRGSMAEVLAEERAAAESEEERDVYRTLLHLLACNLLTNTDVSAFIHFSQESENLSYVLDQALENTKSTEDGDVMVCPNCEAPIKSWARWFDEEYRNSINPQRSYR